MSSNKLTRATQEPAWVRYTLPNVGLGFQFFFLGLPLVAVFVEALAQGLPIYLEALKESETRSAIWLTFVIALAVLPFNILFGVAAAWAIAKFDFKGKSLLITLIDLPFAVSPVVAGLIFILIFGAQGWLRASGLLIESGGGDNTQGPRLAEHPAAEQRHAATPPSPHPHGGQGAPRRPSARPRAQTF